MSTAKAFTPDMLSIATTTAVAQDEFAKNQKKQTENTRELDQALTNACVAEKETTAEKIASGQLTLAEALSEEEEFRQCMTLQKDGLSNATGAATKSKSSAKSKRLLTSIAPMLNETQKTASPKPTPAPAPAPPPPADQSPEALQIEDVQKLLEQAEKVISSLQQMFEQSRTSASRAAGSQVRMGETSDELKAAQKNTLTSDETFTIADMLAFMTAMVIEQVEYAKNQGKQSDSTSALCQSLTDACASKAKQAQDDLKKAQELQYELDHQSFWDKLVNAFKALGELLKMAAVTLGAIALSPILVPLAGPVLGGLAIFDRSDLMKMFNFIGDFYKDSGEDFMQDAAKSGGIFQYIVSSLMIVAGCVMTAAGAAPAGIALAAGGVLMLSMQASGGQNDLDNSINSASGGTLWKKILMDLGVALGEAVALGGISGGLSTAIGSGSENAAEEAGASAASAGASSGTSAAGSAATADTGMWTAEDVEKSILKKFLQNGFNARSLATLLQSIASKTTMLAGTTGMWSDLFRAILEGANRIPGVDTGNDDEASMFGGICLGLTGTVAAGLLDVSPVGSPADMAAKMEKYFGGGNFQTMQRTMTATISLMQFMQSAYNISAGLNQLQQADIVEDMAKAQAAQSLFNSTLDTVSALASASAQANTAVQNNMINANSDWDQMFVAPYQYLG